MIFVLMMILKPVNNFVLASIAVFVVYRCASLAVTFYRFDNLSFRIRQLRQYISVIFLVRIG